MAERPRLLDLFCKAGGAARGYQLAGFHVTGIDNEPQPRYAGDVFVQADALDYLADHGSEFDVIHASPPCQAYSRVNRRSHLAGKVYPDLVARVRNALEDSGRLWVIENVEMAPLRNAVRLCGSSFGLPIRRHRLFESSIVLLGLPCEHGWQRRSGKRYPTCFQPHATYWSHGMPVTSSVVQIYGHTQGVKLWPAALGIHWMNREEMTQAIPPVFTKFIGCQLMAALENAHA